jgi:dolichyl-phosphate beta-glucosyltransferase
MESIYISIIIPGFNEEKRIQKTLHTIYAFCKHQFDFFEIIFVDDGSTDKTQKIVKRIESDIQQIKYIGYPRNKGKGFAIRFGLRHAKGTYIFFTDADLPYDPHFFSHAIEVFERTSCDMISGNRHLKQSRLDAGLSQKRIWASRIFLFVVHKLLDIETTDTQCGIKGFHQSCAQKINKLSQINGYAFDVEIFLLARLCQWHIELLPVVLVNNQLSKIRLGLDPLNILFDILKMYRRFKNFPIFLFTSPM